jgi:hypothetical protein
VNTADKIGLLPGFGWLADRGAFATVAICMAITPGTMFVLGLVGESRLLPWTADKQFLSFFPGDIFLGMAVAGMLVLAQRLPSGSYWYSSRTWHLLVLIGALVVAFLITRGEYNDPNGYGHRAVLSPTKLYHNGVLYGLYGYVIVVVLAALVGGLLVNWSWESFGLLVACLLPMLLWASCLVLEQNDAFLEKYAATNGQTAQDVKTRRVENAHVNDWEPIWAH